MKSSTTVRVLVSIVSITLGLLSFQKVQAADSAQTVHGDKASPKTESPSPESCGLLVPCKGSEKIFMYFCSAEQVTVRLCGAMSKFPVDTQSNCVGDEKTLSRDAFMTYIKSRLDQVSAKNGNLNPIAQDDVAALKSEGSIKELQKQCGDTEYHIKNLKAKRDQLASVLSDSAKTDIDAEITKLEGSLAPVKTELMLCQNKEAAIQRVDDLIKKSVKDICNKGIHIPASDTFMYTVLNQYNPSTHPCGNAAGLTLTQRKKECSDRPKVRLSTGQSFSVIASSRDNDDTVSEYLKDDVSGLVWGPEHGSNHWAGAVAYCNGLKDLGLKWRLPTKEEFVKAGNRDNKSSKTNAPFAALLAGGEDQYITWWTSDVEDDTGAAHDSTAWAFDRDAIETRYEDRAGNVRCVAVK